MKNDDQICAVIEKIKYCAEEFLCLPNVCAYSDSIAERIAAYGSLSRRNLMTVEAYIHSLKDKANDRNVLGEAEIIESIGDNLYLAEYCGVRCTAIFNFFDGHYYVDDVYGIVTGK